MSDYQAEVDVYQEKEVPRHLEDIKKVVAQLEQLSQNLEKSKEEAMVSQGHNILGRGGGGVQGVVTPPPRGCFTPTPPLGLTPLPLGIGSLTFALPPCPPQFDFCLSSLEF